MMDWLYVHWVYTSDWFRRLWAESVKYGDEIVANYKRAWGRDA